MSLRGRTITVTAQPIPIESQIASDDAQQQSGGLGVFGVVLMVVAAAAPLGAVGAAMPLVFAMSGTSGAPLYFILIMALLLIFAVGFIRMSNQTEESGALYTYVRVGLGKAIGFGTAAVAGFGYTTGVIAISAISGVTTVSLIQEYTGIVLPWWVGSFAIITIFGVLGYRSIDLSAKVLGIILVLEIVIVLLMDITVLGQGGREGITLEPFNPMLLTSGAVGLGLLFTFTCFAGFEATTIFRREAKNPKRTIPRATFVALIITGVFYMLAGWALAVGVGIDGIAEEANNNPDGMVGMIIQEFMGTAMFNIFMVMFVTSLAAAGITFHNVVTRYMLTLAQEGVLPKFLSIAHPTYRSPSRASLVLTVLVAVALAVLAITGTDPVGEAYFWLQGLTTLGIVFSLFLTAIAVLAYFIRIKAQGIWATRVAPTLGILGFVTILYLALTNYSVVMNGSQSAANGVMLLMLGIFVFGALYGTWRAKKQDVADILAIQDPNLTKQHPLAGQDDIFEKLKK